MEDTYVADEDRTSSVEWLVSYTFASFFIVFKPLRSKHETMGHVTWLVKERVAVAGVRPELTTTMLYGKYRGTKQEIERTAQDAVYVMIVHNV